MQVVLLHGLARSSTSLIAMELALKHEGFKTLNISYPSTKHEIGLLTKQHILPKIEANFDLDQDVHFVTHSMGGIITRYIAQHLLKIKIGRVVMLSPPNHGSEIVDKLGTWWLFEFLHGPAGMQLSTAEESLPNQLGQVDFELGVITGEKTLNPLLSTLIEGKNDGKVSVESAKIDGMKAFVVLDASHTFIMMNIEAIQYTLSFLSHGDFDHPKALFKDILKMLKSPLI